MNEPTAKRPCIVCRKPTLRTALCRACGLSYDRDRVNGSAIMDVIKWAANRAYEQALEDADDREYTRSMANFAAGVRR